MKKNLAICFFGLLFGPAAILLHEGSHNLAAQALGLRPHLHYESNTLSSADGSMAAANSWVIIAAGPAANALFLLAGLSLLWHLRRNRLQEPTTLLDWVATIPILAAGRWLLAATGRIEPSLDEGKLSVMAGLPRWALPYTLSAIALVLVVFTVRVHPPRSRLVPFGAAVLGCWLGITLWEQVLGPRVLP